MIRRITLELVPHDRQRYNTVGDWFIDDADLEHLIIRGSEITTSMSIAHMKSHPTTQWLEWAVPLHELVEALVCLANGTTPDLVDYFDKQFDYNDYPEPGDSPFCPYHDEHVFATHIEELFVKELGWPFDVYERLLNEPFLRRRRAEAKEKVAQSRLRTGTSQSPSQTANILSPVGQGAPGSGPRTQPKQRSKAPGRKSPLARPRRTRPNRKGAGARASE